eukprot:2384759-Amphidinium_carterae.1
MGVLAVVAVSNGSAPHDFGNASRKGRKCKLVEETRFFWSLTSTHKLVNTSVSSTRACPTALVLTAVSAAVSMPDCYRRRKPVTRFHVRWHAGCERHQPCWLLVQQPRGLPSVHRCFIVPAAATPFVPRNLGLPEATEHKLSLRIVPTQKYAQQERGHELQGSPQ